MNRHSPLRYPGGKGKLSSYIAEVVALNSLEGSHYAEPFAGGAGVALELLFSERVRHIHINDLDPCVYAFWHSAVYETDALVAKIRETPVNVDSWLAAREIKKDAAARSFLELGFATFFLSRTNRSGILNGGVIGGLEQTGKWKIACRFNKEELISRIRRIAFFKSRISVYNIDASLFISDCVDNLRNKCLLYIDPPYYVKGAYLYQNHYSHQDHVALGRTVKSIKRHKWIVSYDNVEPIRAIYGRYEQEQFDIDYTARNYSRGSEVMIFCKGLLRPRKVYCSEKERRTLAAS